LKDLVEIEIQKFTTDHEKDIKIEKDKFPLYSLDFNTKSKRPKSTSFHDWRGQVLVENNRKYILLV
jgi:hypothetical protein